MRTTVGPLPSAVYWRRRAIVLGAVLLGVIVLFVSCSGGDDDKNGAASPTPSAATPTVSSSPTEEPSFTDVPPGATNPSRPAPSDLESSGAGSGPSGSSTGSSAGAGSSTGTGTGTGTGVSAADGSTCASSEIFITAIPAATTVKRGTTTQITLKVKNVSARTCTRDVGADLQELYIESGADKIWSSDTCSNAHGSDVQSFTANGEREYNRSWNGMQDSTCNGEAAAGGAPSPGQYQIRARLGDLVSDPVTITITD